MQLSTICFRIKYSNIFKNRRIFCECRFVKVDNDINVLHEKPETDIAIISTSRSTMKISARVSLLGFPYVL